MVLSFKPQFEEEILMENKIHTIRKDPHNRWKPGRKIHFATGVRTKNYNQFHEGECKSIQSFELTVSPNPDYKDYDLKDPTEGGIINIKIDGKDIPPNKWNQLAFNDGFQHIAQFVNWFRPKFKGKIIHWTDFKY